MLSLVVRKESGRLWEVNIYINDFPKIINEVSHTLLFADDINFSCQIFKLFDLNQKLHSILPHISEWSQTNQLALNTNKIHIVKFTSSKALIYPLNIIHVDQTLAVAETIKFLDLHWDNHLSWKSHIKVLLKALSSVCFMMRKYRKYWTWIY
jgi:hypothetical protein